MKRILIILVTTLMVSMLFACSKPVESPQNTPSAEDTYPALTIEFFDVGQGDAALVTCDGKAMLIDGGDKSYSQKMYAVLKEKQLEELEYVVATSLNDEHIGGLAGALNYASAKETLVGKLQCDSEAFADFKKYADKNGGGLQLVKAEDKFQLGSAEFEVLGVEETKGLLVLKLTYKEISILFAPDFTQDEAEVFASSLNDQLHAAVLKTADHGHDRASSVNFLKKVSPEYAVISSNGYEIGSSVLSVLDMASVELYRTDLHGDTVLKSDGKTVAFETRKHPDASLIYAAEYNQKQDSSDSDKPQTTTTPVPSATPATSPTSESTPQPTADSSLKASIDEIYEANLISNLTAAHSSVKSTSYYEGTSYISGYFMIDEKIASLNTVIYPDGTCSYNGWYDGYTYYDNSGRIVMSAYVEELSGDQFIPGQQDLAWYFQYDEELEYIGKSNNTYLFKLPFYGSEYTLTVDCDSLALLKVEWNTDDGTDGYEYVYGEWIPGQDLMSGWTNGSGLKMISVYVELIDGNETKSLYRPFYLPLNWELEITSAMQNVYSYLDSNYTVPYIYPGDEISFELYVTNAAG